MIKMERLGAPFAILFRKENLMKAHVSLDVSASKDGVV